MKIVSPKQMQQVETLCFKEGASEIDFMEEAGSGVALIVHDFVERHQLDHQVVLLCGKGNNAGDAYVAGIHLLHLEYDVVALQLYPVEESSSLCQQNYRRFLDEGGRIKRVESLEDIILPLHGIVIDGIFGTGFHGQVEEPISSIIKLVNQSKLPVIAIDIPSGLDGATGEIKGEAIKATETCFLCLPKTGFFINEGWNQVGKLRYIDFGLPYSYIEQIKANAILLTTSELFPLLPVIKRRRHKYQAGQVVALSGSPHFPGAALLACQAALRGGAGIVNLLYPASMQLELIDSPYELIKIPYKQDDRTAILAKMNQATATFIGPGLGREAEVKTLLRDLIPQLQKPCVLDADALHFLAEEETPLPTQTILTPHSGEMAKLLNQEAPLLIDHSFLTACQHYAEKNHVTLILKGAPTFIFHPGEQVAISPAGDPGMATAGSGDVLTGLLAALLAQGLTTHQAALLGVYIHGLAGEFAAQELTSYCMNASDILFYFPEGFRLIEI